MYIKEMVLDTVSQFENNKHDLKKNTEQVPFLSKKVLNSKVK